MKLIIAGSREAFSRRQTWLAVEDSGYASQITEVVCGGAEGPDRHGAAFARRHNKPGRIFLPDWGRHGKSAGPRRNREMAAYADAAVVVHCGSRGSTNMIQEMQKLGKPVFERVVYLRSWRPVEQGPGIAWYFLKGG